MPSCHGLTNSVFPLALTLLVACTSGLPEPEPEASALERLFLQQITSNSAIVKWRGEADRACIAASLQELRQHDSASCMSALGTAGNHREVRFTSLKADTLYFYSVGSQSDEEQRFYTAAATGSAPSDGNTRIWLIGDSGTASAYEMITGGPSYPGQAAAVYAGYLTYSKTSGSEPVDLFLLLGDNAYREGTDAQWQEALFEVYPDLLKQTAVWPTIGNHEMGAGPINICRIRKLPQCERGPFNIISDGTSSSSDPASYDGDLDGEPDGTGMPYLDIFSLPAKAEAGGVASGTEQYYSLDYGNVHVISLDSQLSARDADQRAVMRQWLIADLEANRQDWTVVIFHHPPYSKGGDHDSDAAEHDRIDRPQFDLRTEFTPVFEAHGVDVVYSGHSHSYERSYYLRGHTGPSDTYSHAEHAKLIAGDPNNPSLGQGEAAYAQLSPTSDGIDDRVVYTVAGSAGKVDHEARLTAAESWLLHPAHVRQVADPLGRNGLAVMGSVVIDASTSALRARFIDVSGKVLDQFTITR